MSSLPSEFDRLCEKWELEPEAGVWHGGTGIAIPVRQRNVPLVLKISSDLSVHDSDVLALNHWAGRGVVQLIDQESASGSVLLERLGPKSLAGEHWRTAIEVCADLISQSAVPARTGLRTVTELAAELSSNLIGHWNDTGRPIVRTRIDRAREIVENHKWDSTDQMVNWDIYPDNVLQGTRQPWIVIDPKPARGTPEFGVASLLWRLIDDIETGPDIAWTIDTLVKRGNLDPAKLGDWTFVRVVDYWLWALSKGLTEDPDRCSRLLDRLEHAQ